MVIYSFTKDIMFPISAALSSLNLRYPDLAATPEGARGQRVCAVTPTVTPTVTSAVKHAAHQDVRQDLHESACALASPRVTPPVLPNVLWGEISGYIPQEDVLSLRTVHRHMPGWVDRSVRTLRVAADKMPGMMAVIRRSASLKHIGALTISLGTNKNFPAAIAALAVTPHAKLALTIEHSVFTAKPLDKSKTSCLRSIRPASLCIHDYRPLSLPQVRQLADLSYPISLTLKGYRLSDAAELKALAEIPKLVSLDLRVDTFGDDAAQALQQHGGLRSLRILPLNAVSRWDDVALSTTAVVHLAANPALRSLHIGPTENPLEEQAIEALARNRGLLSLTVDTRRYPLDANGASILSKNRSLETLSICLQDGWSHLAHMVSLKNLTLKSSAPIRLDEAQKFAQSNHLQTLDLSGAQFEESALSTMMRMAVKKLEISVEHLNAIEMDALLSNRALRSLTCTFTGKTSPALESAVLLAAHPTLESLILRHDREYGHWFADGVAKHGKPKFFSMVTVAEMNTIRQAWGSHRSAEALEVHF